MERPHNNSPEPNINNNNKECGAKAMEFNEILIMTPETKLENPNKKMYRINGEKSPWVVKNMSGLEFPLITNEFDRKTTGKSISQDTCLTVASDDIDFSRSDISTSSHQVNINEKVSQFLKWDDTISEQKNGYYDILLNQSKYRLPSGLDKNKYEMLVKKGCRCQFYQFSAFLLNLKISFYILVAALNIGNTFPPIYCPIPIKVVLIWYTYNKNKIYITEKTLAHHWDMTNFGNFFLLSED